MAERMQRQSIDRRVRNIGLAIGLALCLGFGAAGHAAAQTAAPAPASPPSPASSTTPKDAAQPAPAVPKSAAPTPATPEPSPPAPSATPGDGTKELAPAGKPQTNEIEPNGSPTTPGTATSEMVEVPARPIVLLKGHSSYDDAFKSIKAAIQDVTAAMDKAGLKPTGHPITIFTDTDDKGFKYEAAIPIAAQPDGKTDLGGVVVFGLSPAGRALKFQHRGPYDEIDATYATITSYLDNKGLQTDSPYIEEYLGDLKTPDDPYAAVDIYIFVKP